MLNTNNTLTTINSRRKDLTGNRFGRLTVIAFIDTNKFRDARWLCHCDCGQDKIIDGNSLKRGATQSCDCWRIERSQQATTTHGESTRRTPEYRAYAQARTRCTNPNIKNYHRYGGRGIEFRFASFDHFLSTIGRRPDKFHSLNRINNDGHYELGNVEWATISTQNNNTSSNKALTLNGVTHNLSEWARIIKVTPATLTYRIKRNWCVVCTLSPKPARCPHVANT